MKYFAIHIVSKRIEEWALPKLNGHWRVLINFYNIHV
jgi:hypothetical protein